MTVKSLETFKEIHQSVTDSYVKLGVSPTLIDYERRRSQFFEAHNIPPYPLRHFSYETNVKHSALPSLRCLDKEFSATSHSCYWDGRIRRENDFVVLNNRLQAGISKCVVFPWGAFEDLR